MPNKVGLLATLLGTLGIVVGGGAHAADAGAQRNLVNKGTVGVIAGSITGTDLKLAADLATAFNEGYDIRVLPIIGEGSVRNIEDLLYLRGIDVAIVQSDVLDFYKRSDTVPNIETRINYIAKLHDEEVHLLARKEIGSIDELAGRRVNLGAEGSGTFLTAGLIFDELGIDIEALSDAQPVALKNLREGTIDALVFVDGAPISLVAQIGVDEPLHLLPIPQERIKGAYLPAQLSADHYPNLIEDTPVATVAIGEVLAAYNWAPDHPRQIKISRFVNRFFDQFERLLEPPYHQKWREVDLGAEIPGWNRLPAAQQRLVSG